MSFPANEDDFESDSAQRHYSYSLDDFELIRVIGRGSYAKVLMVELKKTEQIYAMKVIHKALVTDDEVSNWNIWVVTYFQEILPNQDTSGEDEWWWWDFFSGLNMRYFRIQDTSCLEMLVIRIFVRKHVAKTIKILSLVKS